MFTIPLLIGTSDQKSIVLQTRAGNPIPNSQSLDPDEQTISAFRRMRAKHLSWEIRKDPCGIYNCAGHVWASRRTSIYETELYEQILREDGYRVLVEGEATFQGDIAIYRIKGEKAILHVGVITELRWIGDNVNAQPIEFVLSKLNDLGEVVHHYNDMVLNDIPFEVKFWTDRPDCP